MKNVVNMRETESPPSLFPKGESVKKPHNSNQEGVGRPPIPPEPEPAIPPKPDPAGPEVVEILQNLTSQVPFV